MSTKPKIAAEALALARGHLFATDEQFLVGLSEALARLHSTATNADRIEALNRSTAEHVRRVDADEIAEAKAEGAKAERSRIEAILSAPDAVGNEAFARALAFGGDMAADAAIAALKSAPMPSAEPPLSVGLRSADAPGGLVIIGADGEPALAEESVVSVSPSPLPSTGGNKAKTMWKETIAAINRDAGAGATAGAAAK